MSRMWLNKPMPSTHGTFKFETDPSLRAKPDRMSDIDKHNRYAATNRWISPPSRYRSPARVTATRRHDRASGDFLGDWHNRKEREEEMQLTKIRQNTKGRIRSTSATDTVSRTNIRIVYKRSPSVEDLSHHSNRGRYSRDRSDVYLSDRKNADHKAFSENRLDQVISRQKVNGIWDMDHDQDLTIHMKMNIMPDLDELLEKFCCLQRFGDYRSARTFFDQHLSAHLDIPYVLIHYGELLLDQGDYQTIVALDGARPFWFRSWTDDEHLDNRLLWGYWCMISQVASTHSLSSYRARHDPAPEMIKIICAKDLKHTETIFTSIEVKMLSLALASERIDIRTILSSVPLAFYKDLYLLLLREGRIWDLRDLIVSRTPFTDSPWDISESWSDSDKLATRLKTLVDDWSSQTTENDLSTKLALLEIMTCLKGDFDVYSHTWIVAASLARSLIDNPQALRSRAFSKWMLMEAELGTKGTVHQWKRQIDHMDDWPGMVTYSGNVHGIAMIQYTPRGSDCPGWVCEDTIAEILNSVSIVLKLARDSSDFNTEAVALSRLIFLSADPAPWFEQLEKVQKDYMGSNLELSKTLVMKYMTCITPSSKEKLRNQFSVLWPVTRLSSFPLAAEHLWTISRIRYSLAQNDEEAYLISADIDRWFRELPGDSFNDEAGKTDGGTRSNGKAGDKPSKRNYPPQRISYTSGRGDMKGNGKIPPSAVEMRGQSPARNLTRPLSMADAKSDVFQYRTSHGKKEQEFLAPEKLVHFQEGHKETRRRSQTRGDWRERSPLPMPTSRSFPQPKHGPEPKIIRGPTIEREVITHYRDIDHGVTLAKRRSETRQESETRGRKRERSPLPEPSSSQFKAVPNIIRGRPTKQEVMDHNKGTGQDTVKRPNRSAEQGTRTAFVNISLQGQHIERTAAAQETLSDGGAPISAQRSPEVQERSNANNEESVEFFPPSRVTTIEIDEEED